MAETSIEWTHQDGTKGETWNPTTGCDRISAGCDNCYALTMAKRLKGMGSAKYQTDGDPRTSGPGFGVAVHEDALTIPLKWKTPRTVFVNSMSDLWHAKVPREFVARIFAVMAATPQHTYQILTKRPERMARMLTDESFVGLVRRHYDSLLSGSRDPGEEKFAEIPGYDGYFVSNHGHVYSTVGLQACAWCGVELDGIATKRYCSAEHRSKAAYEQKMGRWSPPEGRRRLSPDAGQQGHLRVMLYRDGQPSRELVHRLVLSAFARPPQDGEQGRHLDSNPANNHVNNLAWGDQAANWSERRRHGQHRSYTKLTAEDVTAIRQRATDGESAYSIARDFPVSDTQIHNVVTGRQWQSYSADFTWPLPSVWLGTSIEDGEHLARADHLRRTPAAVRFISAEPLLGPLDGIDLTGIDWLIAGGESGPGARPMDLDWVRSLLDWCESAGTAPFVKQLGSAWAQGGKGNKPELWPADLRVREYPQPRAEAVTV